MRLSLTLPILGFASLAVAQVKATCQNCYPCNRGPYGQGPSLAEVQQTPLFPFNTSINADERDAYELLINNIIQALEGLVTFFASDANDGTQGQYIINALETAIQYWSAIEGLMGTFPTITNEQLAAAMIATEDVLEPMVQYGRFFNGPNGNGFNGGMIGSRDVEERQIVGQNSFETCYRPALCLLLRAFLGLMGLITDIYGNEDIPAYVIGDGGMVYESLLAALQLDVRGQPVFPCPC